MANVDLKTNFKNGDKLYDYELNNNFKAIKAALEAMNKIVWQNDDNASLVMFAGTTEQITNRELIEGQLLYNTQTGETYIDAMVDTELKRISTGGGTSIQIGGIEPTNPATKLWVEDDLLDNIGSEVVNSLEGNETNRAPSVDAVKKGLINLKSEIIESGTGGGVDYIKYSDGTLIQHFKQTVTANEDRSAGGLTYYSGGTNVNLPIPFIDTNYRASTNIVIANMNYFCQSYVAPNANNEVAVSFASTGQNEQRTIDVILIGKWK